MPGIIEEALVAYTYVGTWIVMSAGVILYNKYILTVFGFPFPVTLTMIHMAFCSALAFVLVRVLGVVKGINMSRETYVQKIVPIAGQLRVRVPERRLHPDGQGAHAVRRVHRRMRVQG